MGEDERINRMHSMEKHLMRCQYRCDVVDWGRRHQHKLLSENQRLSVLDGKSMERLLEEGISPMVGDHRTRMVEEAVPGWKLLALAKKKVKRCAKVSDYQENTCKYNAMGDT
jgi:hypothetical protein